MPLCFNFDIQKTDDSVGQVYVDLVDRPDEVNKLCAKVRIDLHLIRSANHSLFNAANSILPR
jgi:hypothetical protein